MGLLKAAKDSISTILADQGREYFYCDAMPSDLLMTKGKKHFTEGRNSNTKGNDNVISNGSHIVVNEGQCMLIVDQGAIVDFCAEPGVFVYDTSTEPSLFYGNLGENIKNTFKSAWERFTFGGNVAKDQRVYYVNIKEIRGNLYGTANPINFRVVHPQSGYNFETVIKCNGQYSFIIENPMIFYQEVCGNVKDEFTKDSPEGRELMSLMKEELVTNLGDALAPIAAKGVLPSDIPGYNKEICANLKEVLTYDWQEKRGIVVNSMTITPVMTEEARQKMNEWNDKIMMVTGGIGLNASENEARVEQMHAQADFMRNLGKGGSTGGSDPMSAMMGMMTMNMMGNMMGGNNMMGNMMGGNNMMGNATATPITNVPQTPILGWTCSCGATDNRGKFCQNCGSPKPSEAGWTCSCGTVNQGKFCQNCGTKKPAGAPLYKCDKCGWEPEDPANPPKFCQECGDVFDDNDIV